MTRLAIFMIRAYQRCVSPFWYAAPFFPPACNFVPTCSEYAAQAMATHGLRRGLWLSLTRLARCHPWHPGGFDPVPAMDASSDGAHSRPVVR